MIGGGGDDLFVAETADGNDTYWGDEVGGGTGSDTLDMSAIMDNIAVNHRDRAGRTRQRRQQPEPEPTSSGASKNVVTGSGDDHITASDAVNVMDGGAGAGHLPLRFRGGSQRRHHRELRAGRQDRSQRHRRNQGVAGDQAFTLATGAAFTGVGQLLVTQEHRADGDYTVVAGNTAGDAAAEFKFAIKGAPAATAADFTL